VIFLNQVGNLPTVLESLGPPPVISSNFIQCPLWSISNLPSLSLQMDGTR